MSAVFDPLRLGVVALDVLACARASPDALAERQRSRLEKLLEIAVRDSCLYRERFLGRTPSTLQLAALPIIGKSELMARFDDWVTDPKLKLADLQAFMAAPERIAEPYLGKYLVWESSGTGHQPGVFVQDASAMAVYDALEALRRCTPRPLQRWFDPMLITERIAFVGATSGHFASVVSMQRLRELNPWMAKSLQFFSILESFNTLVEQLNDYEPTVIATYPTVASLLAQAASSGVLRFVPKELWSGGESLTAAVRRRVESVFGCTVRNNYGASEFLSIGWECRRGQMHANTDWVILEPVDERGRPTPVGRPSHTTLLTNLANYVQPLIRYDLGDQITIRADPCSCGVSLPVIEVQGRLDDPLVMEGRHGQSVTLLPLALTTVLEDDADVFDFQLRQRDQHTLVLRLNLQGSEAAAAEARCRSALESFAARQGVSPVNIVVELMQAVPRGRSGKAQRVIRGR